MTQIYTILFDLDGTLVDTAPDLMDAHNHVMKKFGHKEKKLSDIKSLAEIVRIQVKHEHTSLHSNENIQHPSVFLNHLPLW